MLGDYRAPGLTSSLTQMSPSKASGITCWLPWSLRPADCIFVLGSHDIRVADYAIDLYKRGFARILLFSGGVIQRNAAQRFQVSSGIRPKRTTLRDAPLREAYRPERLRIEDRSTNTEENFRLTQLLLEEQGLDFQSFILVQKPYMERRVLDMNRATSNGCDKAKIPRRNLPVYKSII